MTDRRLEGKVALISGAARGQGASHARRLAREGAAVVLCDVLDDLGEAEARALRQRGHRALFQHLDVADGSGWRSLVDQLVGEFDRLDVVVNNAGVVHTAPIVEETDDQWRATLDVNATGVFLGMRATIPALIRTGGGSIINVASIYGPVGAHGYCAYGASKAAVIAMTKTAALEHAADGIRANAICPGPVRTPMTEQEAGGRAVDATPLRRRAEVEEISAAVAFLASDESAYMTGAELIIDGGYLAQ